jgi:hypothetical protein
VKFYVRAGLGSLIALGAVAVVLFGIYQVARGGTCASGGPYVSTKECAPGSTAWMFVIPPALLVGLCGIWLVVLRGPRPGTARHHPAEIPPGRPDRPSAGMTQDHFLAMLTTPTPTPTPTRAPAPQAATDPIARLERLQSLLASGALSPAEFQQAKAKILAEM